MAVQQPFNQNYNIIFIITSIALIIIINSLCVHLQVHCEVKQGAITLLTVKADKAIHLLDNHFADQEAHAHVRREGQFPENAQVILDFGLAALLE